MPRGNNKQIHSHWEEVSRSKPPEELVTHKDLNQVILEIDLVSNLLNEEDRVLDIGCGNGFSSSKYAAICQYVIGMDYTPGMVEAAKRAYKMDNLEFKVGDVLEAGPHWGRFTAIVSTRCLINLSSWQEQEKALHNLHSILSKGGRLLLLEGTQQGRMSLSKLREAMDLEPLPKVWHNLDLDEVKLMPLLQKLFHIKRDIRFGLYDMLTRAFYPSVISPDEPKYNSEFHRTAKKMTDVIEPETLKKFSREFCLELVKK
jgi:SAM-dependent methyltransferase